ncbi:ML domain-domain-containing protein [Absidia repens]|uniref:Phosphatidylglycerol/phosphatidylinositol transfer protein n=1 Tax=Absidia repens TaxID=90262 RepID=A0A1X2I2V3_9FUNG|nr:ML domain-domain-containing protein [Absidia repens]
MKLLYFTLLVCVLVSLVQAIYIPPFRVQDADAPLVEQDIEEQSTDLITQCGDEDDILQIEYINLTPETPARGENLHIDFKGTLKETVTDGAYVFVTVKYGYVQLLKKKFDLCDEIDKIDEKCPLEKGPLVLSKDVKLPKAIPGGKYTVEAQVYTENEDLVTCLHGVTSFPK